MSSGRAILTLAILAGAGSAGQLSAQRLPMDVTLEVVEDASTIDAVVMELQVLGANEVPREITIDGESPPDAESRVDAETQADADSVPAAETRPESEPGSAP